jgi:hypothetical protein
MSRADATPPRNEDPDEEEFRIITARATIYCPKCGYSRTFRNRFQRENIELVVVSFKILDWMSCERCGTMLNSRLEYEI